jgi:HD-GYP domain-containing protein (c-di-GMP phosphodiesterase class II)
MNSRNHGLIVTDNMVNQLEHSAGVTRDCRRLACQSITAEIHQFSESLGKAIDAKDHHTSQHSEQVAALAYTLALGLGLSPNQADHIHIAGHLHDIGKIGVSDDILRKAGPLSEWEWLEIKKHPQAGADIIAPVHFLSSNGIVEMVLHHHESYDGKGYPHGLAGNAIPWAPG